jgi:hypothetical protein
LCRALGQLRLGPFHVAGRVVGSGESPPTSAPGVREPRLITYSRPVSPAAKQSTARSAMWCQRGRRVAIMIADFNGSKRKLNGCGGPSWQEARLDCRVSGKPGGGTNHGAGLLWEGPMTGPMPQGPSPTRTSQHGSACFRQYRGSQWLSGCAVARRPPSSGHPDDPSGREWAPCRPVPEQTAWDPAIQRQTLAPTARLRGAVAR